MLIRRALMSRPLHILHLMTKFDFMAIQNLPCEKRFLSCMAFNVTKVIHVPYQFCTWPVLYTGRKQTKYVTDISHVNDFVNATSPASKKPLLHLRYTKLSLSVDCLILVFSSKKGLNHDLPPLKTHTCSLPDIPYDAQ